MLENLIKYLEVNIELAKLDAKEIAVKIIAKMMKAIIVMLLSSFVILFMSLALAFYLDNLLGEAFVGFLIVGLVYLVILSVFWLFRKRLSYKIQESIDEDIPVRLEFDKKEKS